MASSRGVWGIDIGQCALKALRCTLAEDGKAVVAEAFDYIEYPKILSQPEADPDELVRDALAQFLSRNDVRGDKIAISVSGQARRFTPDRIEAFSKLVIHYAAAISAQLGYRPEEQEAMASIPPVDEGSDKRAAG